jgi:hypothetical protein
MEAEKSKADQKFFAAMKSKEARDVEVRTLRMQSSKTSALDFSAVSRATFSSIAPKSVTFCDARVANFV